MKKLLALLLILALTVLTGCVPTTVVVGDCTCGNCTTAQPNAPIVDGTSLKTGLALMASASGSENGKITYDVTMVGVLVDGNGVIADCVIDALGTTVELDGGTITTDLTADILTKTEMGDSYMMTSGSWATQAGALAKFAVGKTVAQLKNGAIDETGKAPTGSDLSSSASIYLGGYVSAIEKAADNAAFLGAKQGDVLKIATISALSGADGDHVQLDVDMAVVTMDGETITSCAIDSLQGKVSFDENGVLTMDVSAPLQSKNQLGSSYGMVSYGGAKYEWFQQAENFAAYVTGKTAAQVTSIAITESGKPADADLSASVTIAIPGLQALIAKVAA